MSETKIENIDTVILCGGIGTRLKEFTKDLPKPMVDIHGQPFLDLLINYASLFGFKRFILCSGYKAEVISKYYSKKNDGIEYVFSEEKIPLGTGGALIQAAKLIKSKVFLCLNGDSFCQVNLKKFYKFYLSKKSNASIALTSTDDPRDYGSIALNKNQEITQFNEKSKSNIAGCFINTGIYLIDRNLIDSFPSQKKISLEYDMFPVLIKNTMHGYIDNAPLYDIGTPERLSKLRKHLQPKDSR